MRLVSWLLLLFGTGLTGLAALNQLADESWIAVLFACLAGGAFSALGSLVIARMVIMHQLLAETLIDIKGTNPLNPELGHVIRIRREVITDLGVRENAKLAREMDEVIEACDHGMEHGRGADPLYRELKRAIFWSAIQSIFWPRFYH